MQKENIFEKAYDARMHRALNNCYNFDVIERAKEIWCIGDDFIFSYDDHGVDRLSFFAKTWDVVNELLSIIDSGHYYLEFMSKDYDEFVPNESSLCAAMMRLSNPDCRYLLDWDSPLNQFMGSALVEDACESDVEEINDILWATFNTEVSHLLSNDELREKIIDGEVTLHRNDKGKIDALLQAEVMPKKFYINQIINKAEKHVVHAILLDRLEKYVNAGGKYLYSWVEDQNIASQKFHAKYGMEHDGMWSLIYRIER